MDTLVNLSRNNQRDIDGLVQDCSNFSALD